MCKFWSCEEICWTVWQNPGDLFLSICDAFRRRWMGRKHPRDGAWPALLISLNPLEESDIRVRVVPGFVHILQTQEVRFALRVAAELQVRQRKRDAQAFIESIPGRSGRTQQAQRNRGELQYLTLRRILRPMPRGHVRYFVGHDTRQLRLFLSAKNQPAIYVKESARQRERIDLVGIDHLDRERHPRIRIAHEILSDAVYVLSDDRIVDNLRRALDLLRQLLTERNFLFQRVEVGTLTHLPIADGLDIVFRISRVYGVLLLDGLLLPFLYLPRLGLHVRGVWRWRGTLRQGGSHCQRAQKC